MHEVACRFPNGRVVLVKRAKSFTFNRTISAADFRQPERHQRLTPCCTLWKKPWMQQYPLLKGPSGLRLATRMHVVTWVKDWRAQAFATTRSAAFNTLEHRSHIVLHVSRPTTCARRQGVPLASMIKTRDVRYQRSHALWNECLPDLDRQLLAKETAIAQRAA